MSSNTKWLAGEPIEIKRRSDLLQHAVPHDKYAIRQCHCLRPIGGHAADRESEAALQILDLKTHLFPGMRIEA